MTSAVCCSNCRRPYPPESAPYRCPVCRGVFDFCQELLYDPAQVEPQQPGLWRYMHALGLPAGAPVVSLGEGSTPLVWAKAFGRELAFKLEMGNPSGSFKDRGSAPLVSFMLSRGVQAVLEDSSGNAGASLAAYAARAGLRARVYVPESASGPKRAQIAAYGAEIVAVPGPRSNAADAVAQAASQIGTTAPNLGAPNLGGPNLGGPTLAYASHAYLPFNLPGYATLAYELLEQLGRAPGALMIPAGQGGLLLGAARGFAALQKAGLIEQMPRLVGVQARACAPLWALSSYGAQGLGWVTEGQTLAEGVRVSFPLRGDLVLQAVESSGGAFVAVDEDDILPGRDQLAQRGLYVEATSAIVWSALEQVVASLPDPVVVVLTGSGLKTPI